MCRLVVLLNFMTANDDTEHWCFSPDSKLVAAASWNFIYVWDIISSEPHLLETFTGA
jgi:hypothetical protein